MTGFQEFELHRTLSRALADAGLDIPTAVQAQAIPLALRGRDIVATAPTGTGKTAAFGLPLLHRILEAANAPTGAARRARRSGRKTLRGLVLVPTRELCSQVAQDLSTWGSRGSIRVAAVFGGVKIERQVKQIQTGIDVLVATPGRLLDLVRNNHLTLADIDVLVLDEADRMLDLGFQHDLKKILKVVPAKRQTMLFSATMPDQIRSLARQWLRRPAQVAASQETATPVEIRQAVLFVENEARLELLVRILRSIALGKTVIFVATRRSTEQVARSLSARDIASVALHGEKTQARRTAVLREFEGEQPPVLVATDLAARGLDFTEVSHVINFDPPATPEVYVHRIGRTARAGASGEAILFLPPNHESTVRALEQHTGTKIRRVQPADYKAVRTTTSASPTRQTSREKKRNAPQKEARTVRGKRPAKKRAVRAKRKRRR